MHVIGHDISKIQVLADLIGLQLRDLILPRRYRRRQQEMLADARPVAIQLVAELLHQKGIVGCILWTKMVADMPDDAGIFPVNVEAVENARCRGWPARSVAADARRQIAFEEHINTGTHEFLA